MKELLIDGEGLNKQGGVCSIDRERWRFLYCGQWPQYKNLHPRRWPLAISWTFPGGNKVSEFIDR